MVLATKKQSPGTRGDEKALQVMGERAPLK